MLNECGILKGRCEIYFHSFSLFFMDCTVMQRVVLIPRNIRGHLKLSSTNVEQPTRNPEKKKKEERSENIGSKSADFVVGSDSIVALIHSLTEKDSIVAYA